MIPVGRGIIWKRIMLKKRERRRMVDGIADFGMRISHLALGSSDEGIPDVGCRMSDVEILADNRLLIT